MKVPQKIHMSPWNLSAAGNTDAIRVTKSAPTISSGTESASVEIGTATPLNALPQSPNGGANERSNLASRLLATLDDCLS